MRKIATIALLAAAATATETTDSPPQLHKNPFDRPPLDRLETRDVEHSFAPDGLRDLRATLVSERGSLVDVGGNILALGETLKDYELIAVSEGEAVFRRGREQIRVTLREEPVESDDEE